MIMVVDLVCCTAMTMTDLGTKEEVFVVRGILWYIFLY